MKWNTLLDWVVVLDWMKVKKNGMWHAGLNVQM